MRPRGGRAKLAVVLAVCAAAVGGVIAALIITRDGHGSAAPLPIAPTTGSWTPLAVARPKAPTSRGAIPTDSDPVVRPNDFNTTLSSLPGKHRYQMTIFNTSNLGAINAFEWNPPAGVRIVEAIDSSDGHCAPTANRNLLCDQLDLKPPSCTCLGDGGSVTISFATDKDVAWGEGDLRVRSATLPFDPIPTYQDPSSPHVREVKRIVTATNDGVDSGGLTAGDREAAQSAVDALQDSNISHQLVSISRWLENVPAACRVRLVSRDPSTYQVYVFWIPRLAADPYVWLDMNVTSDADKGTFRLSESGTGGAKKGRELLVAHAAGAFGKPGATCEVLKNGALTLGLDE